ncbi:MAG: hypothetical protein CK548_02530 [Opitutia bacterium]|nr:MAG: hypothetical protein CK548_02530 [Opitutae bacterium]
MLGAAARATFCGAVFLALLSKTSAPTILDSLADYPRWVVVACVTILLAAAIWVVMKLLKGTLWLLLFTVLIIGLGTAAWLMLR